MSKREIATAKLIEAALAIPEQHRELVLKVFKRLSGPDAESFSQRTNLLLSNKDIEFPDSIFLEVDRTIPPTYPDPLDKLKHPELEQNGPSKYDVVHDVERWRPSRHQTVREVYSEFEETGQLATCLNLQDGIAIQARGVLALSKSRRSFLFASAYEHDGRLLIPMLYRQDKTVELFMHTADCKWPHGANILRFKH